MRTKRDDATAAPRFHLTDGTLSLRRVLILPFVALIVALATIIGWLSYNAGARAVDTMADQLLQETARRISDAIDRRVLSSHAVLEAAFPTGLAAPDDLANHLPALRRRLWIATSIGADSNHYVYYGNQRGQFIGLLRVSNQQAELRYKLSPERPRRIGEFSSIDGVVTPVGVEDRLFDPRERPWYRSAITANQPLWTDVYIAFRNGELLATLARRVLSSDLQPQGVVATDVPLQALNNFVAQLRISPNGAAFIIEPDGLLVASSAGLNVRVDAEGNRFRISAANAGQALIEGAYAAVKMAQSNGVAVDPLRAHRFGFGDGQVGYMAFDKLRDPAGLDWITVVAVPRDDFMAGVTDTVFTTVLLAGFAALLAALIGSLFYAWVAKDLRSLSAAARRVGEGDLDVPIGILRRDEIGELARSFEAMQKRLRTDRLTGLINREAMLRKIDALIDDRRAASPPAPFALLFVDLDDFKSINDEHGHAAGDQALIRVAERLRHSVREDDVVARYAGDEFLILLPAVADRDAAEVVRKHVEVALANPYVARPGEVPTRTRVSGSVGLAMFPTDAKDAETLVRRADAEMYARKQPDDSRNAVEGR